MVGLDNINYRADGSVTEDNEMVLNPSKENQDSNVISKEMIHSNSNSNSNSNSSSNTSRNYKDHLDNDNNNNNLTNSTVINNYNLPARSRKLRSPARSVGNKSKTSIDNNSLTNNSIIKDAVSLPSSNGDTSNGGGNSAIIKTKGRRSNSHSQSLSQSQSQSQSHSYTTATAASTTASANASEVSSPSHSNFLKTSNNPSGLTTPEIQSGHLIKMNPKDSASPRRNRARSSKSKAYKEYETSIEEINISTSTPIDAESLNSWKEDMSFSRASVSVSASMSQSVTASVQSSSVGGLAYIETPTAGSATYQQQNPHLHHFDNNNNNQQMYSPGQPNQHAARYHRTNAGNSISSKSTTSKRSRRSKSSHQNSNNNNNNNTHTNNDNDNNNQPSNATLGPGKEEQILFEQRLCEEGHGVAVRKIHSNGKSQLRFVKCVSLSKERVKKLREKMQYIDENEHSHGHQNMSYSLPSPGIQQRNEASSRSVTSLMGRIAGRKNKSSLYAATTTDGDYSPISMQSKSITNGGGGGGGSTAVSTGVLSKAGTNSNNADDTDLNEMKYTKALAWGNKKKVSIPLYKFVAIRKGKTTKRTRRNASDASKLLSLVTSDEKSHGCLDIEAPTQLDRDKFAKAFSVFLNVPLEDGLLGESVVVQGQPSTGGHVSDLYGGRSMSSDLSSIPSISSYNSSSIMSSTLATPQGMEHKIGGGTEGGLLPDLTPSPTSSKDEPKLLDHGTGALGGAPKLPSSDSYGKDHGNNNHNSRHEKNIKPVQDQSNKNKNIFDMGSNLLPKESPKRSRRNEKEDGEDNMSAVSSLTQGFDQEIVEELHQALTELRSELDASRAEAARAVKVAEQAIQSAESCSSNDWNSTVTHKAAEAAAQAQKRSAEAISKQRQAEEKLAAEKKSASFWRKQAQIAEEDAGGLQTRLAVAEVERSGITEELEREKRKAASYIQTFKRDYAMSEKIQRETLANAAEQNKLLEIELDGTRTDLTRKAEEVKMLQDTFTEMKSEILIAAKEKSKKKFFGKSKKPRDMSNSSGRLLLESESSSTLVYANYNDDTPQNPPGTTTPLHSQQLLQIHAETADMKKQFELLRRTTIDELQQLPNQAKVWANAASKALLASQTEVTMLKNRLAMEMANRRKLLGEVQDLRGSVRVYCRPRPITSHNLLEDGTSPVSIISVPSHEVGLLHRELIPQTGNTSPMSFDFDRMFTSNTTQRDVYAEMEELVLTSLDGYNSCLMAFGQNGCGKTHSLVGDFSITQSDGVEGEPRVEILDRGIHLLAMQQIFTVSNRRHDRFQDSFTMTMVEIHDEKLTDLMAETDIAISNGHIIRENDRSRSGSNSHTTGSKLEKKLEIRTNIDGETIVQGLVSVPIESYEDVEQVWKQSLSQRAKRVQQMGKKLRSYEASTHIIITLQVVSTNSITGVGTIGKVQFIDLAASDVVPRRSSMSSKSRSTTPMDNILAPIGNTNEWKFANKSITQLSDVVNARYQFSRSVPYRNSTLTHLLLDSLESDTKVLLLACVSSDAKDLQNTANTMRFAAKMKKVIVGKATKHTVSFA